MTTEHPPGMRVRQLVAVVAILFGIATIGAGGGVLTGSDPGYVVYRPLLLFNTLMGFLYVGAGVLAWRGARAARMAAAALAGANLLVLTYVTYLYRTGGGTAIDSVRAMMLRTGVWLVALLVLTWVGRVPRDATSR